MTNESTAGLPRINLSDVRHVGVVVRDIEVAKEHYARFFGLDEWRIVDSDVPQALLRGKPTPAKIRFAFARSGETTIELIQVLEGRTAHSEFLKLRGEGVHHLAFNVEDLDAELEKAQQHGIEVVQLVNGERVSWAYLDTTAQGGLFLELIQPARRE